MINPKKIEIAGRELRRTLYDAPPQSDYALELAITNLAQTHHVGGPLGRDNHLRIAGEAMRGQPPEFGGRWIPRLARAIDGDERGLREELIGMLESASGLSSVEFRRKMEAGVRDSGPFAAEILEKLGLQPTPLLGGEDTPSPFDTASQVLVANQVGGDGLFDGLHLTSGPYDRHEGTCKLARTILVPRQSLSLVDASLAGVQGEVHHGDRQAFRVAPIYRPSLGSSPSEPVGATARAIVWSDVSAYQLKLDVRGQAEATDQLARFLGAHLPTIKIEAFTSEMADLLNSSGLPPDAIYVSSLVPSTYPGGSVGLDPHSLVVSSMELGMPPGARLSLSHGDRAASIEKRQANLLARVLWGQANRQENGIVLGSQTYAEILGDPARTLGRLVRAPFADTGHLYACFKAE